MRTYAGIVSDWFTELLSYRSNNSVEPVVHVKGVKYSVYEWKYASRVLAVDINETVRVFYRVDFPVWVEYLCYLLGWFICVAAAAVAYKIIQANPGMQSTLTVLACTIFYLTATISTGRPDILPLLIAMALEHMADKISWKYSDRRFGKINFQVIYDKDRCRYFRWTLLNVYSGNRQLRSALEESNTIMKRLGLENQVQM